MGLAGENEFPLDQVAQQPHSNVTDRMLRPLDTREAFDLVCVARDTLLAYLRVVGRRELAQLPVAHDRDCGLGTALAAVRPWFLDGRDDEGR